MNNMTFTIARKPAPIDKAKQGSFGNASDFTALKKMTTIADGNSSKTAGVKNEITRARASPGFSVLTSIKLASANAPVIAAKIKKTHT